MGIRTQLTASIGLISSLFVQDVAHACAACRNPSLPTANSSAGPLPAKALRTGLLLSSTSVHVVHSAGCEDEADCDEVPIQPEYLHDQRLLPLELRLTAEYGLSETLGIELQVPLRMVKAGIEFTTPSGEHYDPPDADVHHRNETIFGLGDPLLMGRAGGLFRGTFLAARLGVSLPLGRTEEDPFALGDQGERHQHIQFGTGTFDPTLGLEVSRRIEKLTLGWFAQTTAALYENRHGFRSPFRVQSGVNGDLLLGAGFSGGLGVGGVHEGSEHWQGEVRQDASLGRQEIYGQASVGYTLQKTQFSLNARFPLYRRIIAGGEETGEYSSPLTLQIGLTHLWEPKSDG